MAKDLKMCALIDTYGAMLTEKQLSVLQMYYFDDFSLSEIAELEGGISRQGVRDSIKRGECILEEMEGKLHFAGRFNTLTETVEKIKKSAKDIIAYAEAGSNSIYSERILKAARNIVEAGESLSSLVEEEEDGI